MAENGVKLKGGKTTNTELYVQIVIIAALALLLTFNVGRLYDAGGLTGAATGIGIVSASEVIPKGVPAIYGDEIGVSYDGVSASNPQLADATIRKMRSYEDMTLTPEQMERYIEILYVMNGGISCEYCCGARSIIFEDGKAACGCAHSYAMRGLAKYLLTEHPEMSDEDILSELGKWKVLFFPGIHEQKAQVLESEGIDSKDYINLASNLYRGIEKGQSASGGSGMVGGC
jgi:hypothetical protein